MENRLTPEQYAALPETEKLLWVYNNHSCLGHPNGITSYAPLQIPVADVFKLIDSYRSMNNGSIYEVEELITKIRETALIK